MSWPAEESSARPAAAEPTAPTELSRRSAKIGLTAAHFLPIPAPSPLGTTLAEWIEQVWGTGFMSEAGLELVNVDKRHGAPTAGHSIHPRVAHGTLFCLPRPFWFRHTAALCAIPC